MQTCRGYLCSECNNYYGEAGEHRLGDQTCYGYECLDCYDYFGEAGEHRLGEQTCQGYECLDCYGYFGEAGEHRLGEQTCQGYECLDCYDYFGEAGDHFLGSQTCKGSRCYYCYEYFGEGNDEHSDGDDAYNNLCDFCKLYFGPTDFTTGEQTVRYEDYYGQYLLRFIPEESGVYIMSSHATEESGMDPLMYSYRLDENGYLVTLKDGYNENGKNFYVELELVAGEPYYFVFYSTNQYDEYPINFYLDTHVHSGGEQTCKGYLCKCGDYYGDPGDHTPTGEMTCFGTLCSVCDEYFGDATEHNRVGEITGSGYYCDKCEMYQGEGDDTKHSWYKDRGRCDICEKECQHGEYDEGGKCLICSRQIEYMVINGESIAFYESLSDAIAYAEEGSTIKLLTDTAEGVLDFNKKLTFDLAGREISNASSDSFWIYDEVTFTDSVGGGYLGLGLRLVSPVTFEGGSYKNVFIEFETDDVIADYLPQCYQMVDRLDNSVIDVSNVTSVLSFVVVLSHNAGDATCLGHSCENCGESLGEADPDAHKLSEPTCTTPATCELCDTTVGEASGHNWIDATCDISKTCSVCGDTDGEALGHEWKDATYDSPKTCENCGVTEGEPLERPSEPPVDDNPDEETPDETTSETPEEPSWFIKLINAILDFFRRLFGIEKRK